MRPVHLGLLVLAGCVGEIRSAPGPEPVAPNAEVPLLDAPEVLPLKRLTRDELSHTLRDLLGLTARVGDGFPEDAVGASGFYAPGAMSTLEVQYLLEAMEGVGGGLSSQLPALVACDVASRGEAACAREFIERFGRRAWRRPLATEEVDDLLAFFSAARVELDYPFYPAAQLTLEVMLQSPNFLYHRESGGHAVLKGGVVTADANELASRLSYFLWSSMPDDALFAAADQGRLSTPEDVEREARRMLKDPRFRDTLEAFHLQWLGIKDLSKLQKDPAVFPEFTPALVAAMQRETLDFVTNVLDSDGRLVTLLTAPYSYVNADLARLYGIKDDSLTSDAFVRIELDGATRSGLLTQASFLAWGATVRDPLPPRRGKKILERFLCGTVPPPPDDVPPPPPPKPDQTNRERFELHEKNGCASACHGVIDPLGFAFEGYDAVGRFRTMDGTKPVNASGTVKLTPAANPVSFANAVELNHLLAQSPSVGRCVGTQWVRFGLGRGDLPGDARSIDTALDSFLAAGTDLRELLVQVAVSRAFRERAPAEGETF